MADFIVIPAIDLRSGRCVRLRRGIASEETVYDTDPLKVALRWEQAGAACIHVVDLDGAFAGSPRQTAMVIKIAAAVKIPVEAGGGLRTKDHIRKLVESGVARAIIGTAACESREFTAGLIGEFGPALAMAVDAHDGLVQTAGWTSTSAVRAIDLAERLDRDGARTLIYTDTGRDGMLSGPNIQAVEKLCGRVRCSVIASGGVSAQEDIDRLRALSLPNLGGVIVGKALYEGKVDLCKNKPVNKS